MGGEKERGREGESESESQSERENVCVTRIVDSLNSCNETRFPNMF